jgi:hypothetical protein
MPSSHDGHLTCALVAPIKIVVGIGAIVFLIKKEDATK